MALLDDISVAKQLVQDRVGDTLKKNNFIGRYTWDNIGQAGSDSSTGWDGKFAASDRERWNQMDLLSQAVSDPSWTGQIEDEATKRQKAGDAQADADYRMAESQRRVTAARSGTAAGANDAAIAEENRQRVASIKAQVTQQVAELKAAGIQNLEDMGRQLLDKALAGGDESSAMSVANQGAADNRSSSSLAASNADDFRALLSNTVGGFLSQSVAPTIAGGFTAADRWNSAQQDSYTDARNTGSYTGTFSDWANANGGTRSWYGF